MEEGKKALFFIFRRGIRYGYDTVTGRPGIDGLIGFGSGLGFSSFYFFFFSVGYVNIWSFKTFPSLLFLAFPCLSYGRLATRVVVSWVFG